MWNNIPHVISHCGRGSRGRHHWGFMHGIFSISDANRLIGEVVQLRTRPLLGPFLYINCNNVKYSFIPLHIQTQTSNLAAVLHTIENIPCMNPEWCLPRLPRPQWDMTWDIVSHSGFCTQLNKNLSSAEVSHVPGVGETAELHCHRRYYIIWSTNFLHHPFQLIFFVKIINPHCKVPVNREGSVNTTNYASIH